MILYIDETENSRFFIVAGLLAPSESSVELAYKRFKKSLKGQRIGEKSKSLIYTEFKSSLIDRNYYRVKEKMLQEISSLNADIFFSCYEKKTTILNQIQKEAVYITLITNILSELNCNTNVIFDRFGLADFEHNIINSAKINDNVTEISPRDSQEVHGLQFADNICSTVRLFKSNEDYHDYYKWIAPSAKEV